MEEIINKVASSGLITIDLESLFPEGTRLPLDISGQLWQGLVLREKEFRDWVKTNNWSAYDQCYVALYCSADAIVPHWAYMLVASALEGHARRVVLGTPDTLETVLFNEIIAALPLESYRDARLVIKGCSEKPVPVSAYVELVNRLQPIARSILFGEPCSTVPVFKRK